MYTFSPAVAARTTKLNLYTMDDDNMKDGVLDIPDEIDGEETDEAVEGETPAVEEEKDEAF